MEGFVTVFKIGEGGVFERNIVVPAVEPPDIREGGILKGFDTQQGVIDAPEAAMGDEEGHGIEAARKIDHHGVIVNGDEKPPSPFDQDDVAKRFDLLKGPLEKCKVDRCTAVRDIRGCGEGELKGDDVIKTQLAQCRIKRRGCIKKAFSVHGKVDDTCFDRFVDSDAQPYFAVGFDQQFGGVGFADVCIRGSNKDTFGQCNFFFVIIAEIVI